MAGSTARLARVFFAAGSIALVSASAATAATFKSDSGKLAASKVSGVTASGGTLSFSGTANPTGTTKFAGQIDFTSGQATKLSARGKLTLKHSGKTAALNVTAINGTTLSAKLGSKSLTFPLSYSGATTTPKSKFTAVSVSGVAVNLSSTDASALNKALKTTAYKSGKKFGTLSYNGIDRELIETSSGGPLALCNSTSFTAQNTANGVTASPIKPAKGAASAACNKSDENGTEIKFPEAGTTVGFIDTATTHGRITVNGGIKDTQGSTTGTFTSPIFDLLGSNSVLSAVVHGGPVSLGRQTVATVAITAAPKLTITKSGGTFTIPPSGTTVAINNTGASLLDASFCNSTNSNCANGANAYTAGEAIGYSGGTTNFK